MPAEDLLVAVKVANFSTGILTAEALTLEALAERLHSAPGAVLAQIVDGIHPLVGNANLSQGLAASEMS
jgi:hypothetical protein